MDDLGAETVLRNLDQRVGRIEQILPTLATREEMRAAIAEAVAPLATKEELRAAIAPLATKEELYAMREELYGAIHEEGERTRRHFDVVAEHLGDQIKVIAEGHRALQASVDDLRIEIKADLADHERRLTALEAERRRPRRG